MQFLYGSPTLNNETGAGYQYKLQQITKVAFLWSVTVGVYIWILHIYNDIPSRWAPLNFYLLGAEIGGSGVGRGRGAERLT